MMNNFMYRNFLPEAGLPMVDKDVVHPERSGCRNARGLASLHPRQDIVPQADQPWLVVPQADPLWRKILAYIFCRPPFYGGVIQRCRRRRPNFGIWLLIAIFITSVVLVPVETGFAMDTNASPFEIADATKPEEIVANKKLRDPFWPIGYMKVESERVGEKQPVTNEEWKKARSLLRGGGVVKVGNKYYATVNGMMVKAEDVIAVEVDGKVFKFRVRSINMQGIKFEEIHK